jgi:hypothetical protein
MDDTNQTNQPLDQNAVPGPLPPITPPAAPTAPVEDITPVAEPVAPSPVAPTSAPISQPVMPPVPESTTTFTASVTTPQPYSPPQASPLVAAVPEVTPLPTPTPTEPTMPTGKPKNKAMPILGVVAGLLLVVGVAGAAYYVSNQLSTRQAVAPTAPESKPMAGAARHDYIKMCSRKYLDGGCSKPNGKKSCWDSRGSRSDKWGYGACGTYDCGAGKQRLVATNCDTATKTKTFYYAKCESTTTCNQQLVVDLPVEVTDKEEPVITFEDAGWVNVAFNGKQKITLEPVAGGTPIVIATDSAGLNILSKVFEVKTAGEKYKITLRMGNETKDAYGFRVPLDEEETKCGQNDPKYGAVADISTMVNAVSSKILTDGVLPSSIQCWGDSQVGDSTQDFDFNDAAIIFGYDNTSVVGACNAINIYKKTAGAYGTTPLTATELMALKVGDVLKFTLTSSVDNLKGRFGVTIKDGTVSWLTGTIDATDKKLVTYSDYTIGQAEKYKFEAQVSTIP